MHRESQHPSSLLLISRSLFSEVRPLWPRSCRVSPEARPSSFTSRQELGSPMSTLDAASTQSMDMPGSTPPGPESPPNVAIEFGALTDKGKARDRNEDHFLVARLAKSKTVCRTSLPD